MELTANPVERDASGEIRAPDAPGLGIAIDAAAVRRYQLDTELRVAGRTLYRSPAFDT